MRKIFRQHIRARRGERVFFPQGNEALNPDVRPVAHDIRHGGVEEVLARTHFRHLDVDSRLQIGVINFSRVSRRHLLRRFDGARDFGRASGAIRDRAAGKSQIRAQDRILDRSSAGEVDRSGHWLRKIRRERLKIGQRTGQLEAGIGPAELANMWRKQRGSFERELVQAVGRLAAADRGNTVARRRRQRYAVEEKIVLPEIADVGLNSPGPGPRCIERSVAFQRQMFGVAAGKFLGLADITAQSSERNIFRDEPQLHVYRLRRFLEPERTGDGSTGERSIDHHLERARRDMRRVEGEEPDLIFLVENHAAQNKVLVRVGGFRGNVSPGVGRGQLQRGRSEHARIFRIQLQLEMFENEIRLFGRRADQHIRVRHPQSLRENREQPQTFVRLRDFRFQRCFCGIEYDPRVAHLDVLQQLGRAVPHPIP